MPATGFVNWPELSHLRGALKRPYDGLCSQAVQCRRMKWMNSPQPAVASRAASTALPEMDRNVCRGRHEPELPKAGHGWVLELQRVGTALELHATSLGESRQGVSP